MNTIAKIVSTIFEPMLILGGMVVFEGIRVGLQNEALYGYTSLIVCVFLAVIAIRFSMVRKQHTNWDVSDRKKRLPLFAILLVVNMVFVALSYIWHVPMLTQFFIAYLLWFIGFFAITLVMKLSGHVAVATLGIAWAIDWFGPSLYPLVLVIPLLAWSRLMLKRHTLAEVIVGFFYSVGFLIVGHSIGLLPK